MADRPDPEHDRPARSSAGKGKPGKRPTGQAREPPAGQGRTGGTAVPGSPADRAQGRPSGPAIPDGPGGPPRPDDPWRRRGRLGRSAGSIGSTPVRWSARGRVTDRLAAPDLRRPPRPVDPTPPAVDRPDRGRGTPGHGVVRRPTADRGARRPGWPATGSRPWRPPTRGGPPPDRSGPPPGRSGVPFERPYRDRPARPSGPPVRPTPGPWPRPAPDAGPWPRPAPVAARSGPARTGRGARRRPPSGRGGLRGRADRPPAAGGPAAPERARAARPPCDPPAHPDRRGRGRLAHRDRRLRRPPGRRPRRRAATVRHARRHHRPSRGARRAAVRARARLARGSAEPRHAAAQRRGGRRPRRRLPDPTPGPAVGPAAVKASAGATEHLLLCPVDDLPGALADLHAHGLRIAGSEADAPLTAARRTCGAARDRRRQRGPGSARPSAAAATCSCASRCAARSGR